MNDETWVVRASSLGEAPVRDDPLSSVQAREMNGEEGVLPPL
jgi:hypothetical protein